jgi:hypothetical protein
VLDFGNVIVGNTLSSLIDVSNNIGGPADALNGSYNLSGAAGLGLSGFGAFSNLTAGADTADMGVSFFASLLGAFQQQIVLNGFSVNASDPLGIAEVSNLFVRANVVADGGGGGNVPEPSTAALLLVAGLAGLATRRRRSPR